MLNLGLRRVGSKRRGGRSSVDVLETAVLLSSALLILDRGAKTPYFILQQKYWTPATEPSFLPSGFSSSTPAQRPPENSVLPQNCSVPTLCPATTTQSPMRMPMLAS